MVSFWLCDILIICLLRYYKHSNFASFTRQLNLYGFQKRSLKHDLYEFTHPQFRYHATSWILWFILQTIRGRGLGDSSFFSGSETSTIFTEFNDEDQVLQFRLKFAKWVQNHSRASEESTRDFGTCRRGIRMRPFCLNPHRPPSLHSPLPVQTPHTRSWLLRRVGWGGRWHGGSDSTPYSRRRLLAATPRRPSTTR
jgi:hypothetical protein